MRPETAVMTVVGAQAVGSMFGERTAMQVQGRENLAQRGSGGIESRPRHAQPDIPFSRPHTSCSGASAEGPFAVPISHEYPLSRQPFTGVKSPCTLAFRKRRKEGT